MALPREKVWWRSWSVLLIGMVVIGLCTIPAFLSPATPVVPPAAKPAGQPEEAEIYLTPTNGHGITVPAPYEPPVPTAAADEHRH